MDLKLAKPPCTAYRKLSKYAWCASLFIWLHCELCFSILIIFQTSLTRLLQTQLHTLLYHTDLNTLLSATEYSALVCKLVEMSYTCYIYTLCLA